ncbi:MAG: DUF6691 family protein, partial [Gammaproteobacteria bacterium]
VGGIVAGGAIFGVGWAISGYCPGTCVVGTAEGKLDAVFTLAGALVGALLFSLIYPSLDAWLLQNANLGKITIVDLIGIEGVYLAIPFSLMLLALAFFILKDRYDTEH